MDTRIVAIEAVLAAIDGILATGQIPDPIKKLVAKVTGPAKKIVREHKRSDDTEICPDE